MNQTKEMPAKLPYRSPRLTVFGSVSQRTGFSHKSPHSRSDGGIGAFRKTS
jgi:hypothetical protein